MIGIFTYAISANASDIPNSEKALVYDDANLLSPSEMNSLTSKLEALNKKHAVNIIIVTTKDTGGKTDMVFADDYYDYNGYDENGAVLLINMNPKGWTISTAGTCIRSFTDYGIQRIGSIITPDLKAGDFNAAFIKFINTADDFLTQAKNGTPYDTNHPYAAKVSVMKIIIAMLLLALAIALIIVRILAFQMNTVRRQQSAKAYEKGMNLTTQSDIYLYSHTTSHKIESSSSGGGSSTHTSSSGRTHGGGGGKF